jgi:hypothetical protein
MQAKQGRNITALWDIVTYSLTEVHQLSEAVSTSETLVYFHETAWYNIPEGSVIFIHAAVRTLNLAEKRRLEIVFKKDCLHYKKFQTFSHIF